MNEAKFQVFNLKKWKLNKQLLESTKEEIMDDRKSIAYSLDLPGKGHGDVIKRYNNLIHNIDMYNDYIHAYDVIIKRLEQCINKLLNAEQKEIIGIYINNPNKGDSLKRENIALDKGYSRTKFYDLANQSFKILNEALNENKITIS